MAYDKVVRENLDLGVFIVMDNNLGCGKPFNMNSSTGFICGVADGNGRERLCKSCDAKLREKWANGKY